VRYIGYLVLAAGIVVTSVANAKCASISTGERFLRAKTVVLVAIVSVRDGSVPDFYGLGVGPLPGKLLTLRVIKSWKGSLHAEDVISGWTFAPNVEHAYPNTDVGTKIIVFFSDASQHDVLCCNSSYPDRLGKTSEELNAIARAGPSIVDPNNRWRGPC
jgi:hypothetical protein